MRPTATETPDALTRVFDPDTHTYTYGGRVMPSVTQVLADIRLIDFSDIPPGTLAEAQARGTYVHQVMHAVLEDDFDLADCDPRFRPYVDSGLRYTAEAKLRPVRDASGRSIAVEWRFWHVRRWFAGTIDYVALDPDDILTIIDWKTGQPTDVAASLQTGAYELGVRDYLAPSINYAGPIRRRAVKLFRDGATGKPEPYDDPKDLAVFLSALTCVHFKRNGLAHGGGYAHV